MESFVDLVSHCNRPTCVSRNSKASSSEAKTELEKFTADLGLPDSQLRARRVKPH